MMKKVPAFMAVVALVGAGLFLTGCLPADEDAPVVEPVAEEEVLLQLDTESLTPVIEEEAPVVEMEEAVVTEEDVMEEEEAPLPDEPMMEE